MHTKLLQSCPTLWDTMDYSLPGLFVHGILLARILEWIAMPSSRGSSQSRDQTHVSYFSCIDRWILPTSATWESLIESRRMHLRHPCGSQDFAYLHMVWLPGLSKTPLSPLVWLLLLFPWRQGVLKIKESVLFLYFIDQFNSVQLLNRVVSNSLGPCGP